MDHERQPSYPDSLKAALAGARSAVDSCERLERRVGDIERDVAELQDNQRPSRVDANFEERVIAALQKRTSDRPDIEVSNPKGIRVRGSGWSVAIVSIALLLFALIWQGPELLAALRK